MKVPRLKIPTNTRNKVKSANEGLNAAAQLVKIRPVVTINVAGFLPNLSQVVTVL